MFKLRLLLVAVLGLLLFTSPAFANLITIGTATYGGSDYNLIWDDDNNGNSVIWLDYTNDQTNWTDQNAWAAGLHSDLSYNIDAAYSVTWDESAWRLGSTVDGLHSGGYDGTTTAGWNITTSEMGHLFYEELGNLGSYDTSGTPTYDPSSDHWPFYGLLNTGDFQNLVVHWYLSGTEYAIDTDYAWGFHMYDGYQGYDYKEGIGYGLAVRSGQVSSAAPVPEPGTLLLLGSGIAGLALYRRRMNKP